MLSYGDLDMSHCLNSLKGGCIGGSIKGGTIGDIQGDTRSLDYSSYEDPDINPNILPLF